MVPKNYRNPVNADANAAVGCHRSAIAGTRLHPVGTYSCLPNLSELGILSNRPG